MTRRFAFRLALPSEPVVCVGDVLPVNGDPHLVTRVTWERFPKPRLVDFDDGTMMLADGEVEYEVEPLPMGPPLESAGLLIG